MTETPPTTACPSCGAALRPGAPWCTLCYTDLRPQPEPEPVAQEPSAPLTVPATAAYGVPVGDPLTQPLVDFLPRAAPRAEVPAAQAQAAWPCLSCSAVNPLSEDRCSVCGQPFLAAVKASDKPLLVLPLLGDLGAMGRGKRLGVAAGLVAIVLVPLALITLLLTERPPANAPATIVPSTSQQQVQPLPTATP